MWRESTTPQGSTAYTFPDHSVGELVRAPKIAAQT